MSDLQTMTRASLVDALYSYGNKNRTEAKILVDDLIDLIKMSIRKDRRLLITGFGKFEVRRKKSRPGRNPRTNTIVPLGPRNSIVFKSSRGFRDRLNTEE